MKDREAVYRHELLMVNWCWFLSCGWWELVSVKRYNTPVNGKIRSGTQCSLNFPMNQKLFLGKVLQKRNENNNNTITTPNTVLRTENKTYWVQCFLNRKPKKKGGGTEGTEYWFLLDPTPVLSAVYYRVSVKPSTFLCHLQTKPMTFH